MLDGSNRDCRIVGSILICPLCPIDVALACPCPLCPIDVALACPLLARLVCPLCLNSGSPVSCSVFNFCMTLVPRSPTTARTRSS